MVAGDGVENLNCVFMQGDYMTWQEMVWELYSTNSMPCHNCKNKGRREFGRIPLDVTNPLVRTCDPSGKNLDTWYV
jgi:hypothetical protein